MLFRKRTNSIRPYFFKRSSAWANLPLLLYTGSASKSTTPSTETWNDHSKPAQFFTSSTPIQTEIAPSTPATNCLRIPEVLLHELAADLPLLHDCILACRKLKRRSPNERQVPTNFEHEEACTMLASRWQIGHFATFLAFHRLSTIITATYAQSTSTHTISKSLSKEAPRTGDDDLPTDGCFRLHISEYTRFSCPLFLFFALHCNGIDCAAFYTLPPCHYWIFFMLRCCHLYLFVPLDAFPGPCIPEKAAEHSDSSAVASPSTSNTPSDPLPFEPVPGLNKTFSCRELLVNARFIR